LHCGYAHQVQSLRKAVYNEFGLNPCYPIPELPQKPLPPRVRHNTLSVATAINFNHDLETRRQEIHDVAVTDEDLALERNSKLFSLERGPKSCFRRRCLMPHLIGAFFEECLAFELLTLIEHVFSLPSKAAVLRQNSRRVRDTCEPGLTMLDGVWRGTCAVGGPAALLGRGECEQLHAECTRSRGDIHGDVIVN